MPGIGYHIFGVLLPTQEYIEQTNNNFIFNKVREITASFFFLTASYIQCQLQLIDVFVLIYIMTLFSYFLDVFKANTYYFQSISLLNSPFRQRSDSSDICCHVAE
eukprot:GHVL01001359.1.p2 GENE.GHVL01001359.1~~GHVL01001359.1.p2  ORF type:complete len:105 (+),score=7.51 GHVL01001359.1:2499-2813(+)